ncbi:MAG: RNA polymerase sigma factor [Bacteroidetes bacterium]|nr:RNA polymerase sigma factor [Bacteroidota bacterium]MDF1863909.1 RNA polymerase sigma factor [Saprospiraceae bacterium]
MTKDQIVTLINACRKNDRESQQALYRHFYNYGMTICMRYAGTREEAKEILNDGFVKVFLKIDRYSPNLSFKGWLNKILVNTAIDHFRKFQNEPQTVDLIHAQHYEVESEALLNLSVEAIFDLINKLPPAYRMAFNLYAVEGYKHSEIAEKLGISVGTSKSNLAKAKMKLKSMITKADDWRNVSG